MDSLMRFIADESLDPPLSRRAENAAKEIDPSPFANFDTQKAPCSDAQRACVREFLRLAGIEFDDGGWEEFLTRKDAQQLLAAALAEGVIRAKVPAVTIAFCRIRSKVEKTLAEPAFPVAEDPPKKDAPPDAPRVAKTPADPEAAERAVGGVTIDWSRVPEDDRASVRECFGRHVGGSNAAQREWYGKIGIAFLPHDEMVHVDPDGPQRHLLYRIRETNGRSAFFDGIYRDGDRCIVAPLPHHLLDGTADED